MTEGEQQTEKDPLKQALGGYLAIPGIKAALLVSDQGLVISSIAREALTVVFAPFTPDVMLVLLAAPGSVGILLGQLSGVRGVPVQTPRGG
jgi:hypothetical protein